MAEAGFIFGILGFGFGVVAWIHARVTSSYLIRRCDRLQHQVENLKAAILLPTREEVRAMFRNPEGYGKVVHMEETKC